MQGNTHIQRREVDSCVADNNLKFASTSWHIEVTV